jgi:hypothetical protein
MFFRFGIDRDTGLAIPVPQMRSRVLFLVTYFRNSSNAKRYSDAPSRSVYVGKELGS